MDPLVGFLLPFEREARRLSAAAAQDRAVGLRCLLQHIGRQPDHLIEAAGVGQHRSRMTGEGSQSDERGGQRQWRAAVAKKSNTRIQRHFSLDLDCLAIAVAENHPIELTRRSGFFFLGTPKDVKHRGEDCSIVNSPNIREVTGGLQDEGRSV